MTGKGRKTNMTSHKGLGFEHDMPGVTGANIKHVTPSQEQRELLRAAAVQRVEQASDVLAMATKGETPAEADATIKDMVDDAGSDLVDHRILPEDAEAAALVGLLEVQAGGTATAGAIHRAPSDMVEDPLRTLAELVPDEELRRIVTTVDSAHEQLPAKQHQEDTELEAGEPKAYSMTIRGEIDVTPGEPMPENSTVLVPTDGENGVITKVVEVRLCHETSPSEDASKSWARFEAIDTGYTHEQIIEDISDRIMTPTAERSGPGIIIEGFGERRAGFDIELDDETLADVQGYLLQRLEGIVAVKQIVVMIGEAYRSAVQDQENLRTSYEDEGRDVDLNLEIGYDENLSIEDWTRIMSDSNSFYIDSRTQKPRLHPHLQRRFTRTGGIFDQFGLSNPDFETVGIQQGGDLIDLYISPDDIAELESIRALMAEFSGGLLNDEEATALGLTQDSYVRRYEAFVAMMIPVGAKLMHSTAAISAIAHSGSISGRIGSGIGDGSFDGVGRGGITGTHSNLLHLAEPGNINGGYGPVLVAVSADKLIDQAPFLLQERMYGQGKRGWHGILNAARLRRVKIPLGPDTPPVVVDRVARLKDKHENGFMSQTSQGETNNITFAASLDPSTAGHYNVDIDDTEIIVKSEQAPEILADLCQQGYPDEWLQAHIRVVRKTSGQGAQIHAMDLSMGDKFKYRSVIRDEIPRGMKKDSLEAYAPIYTLEGFDERNLSGYVVEKPTAAKAKRLAKEAEVRLREEELKMQQDIIDTKSAEALGLTLEEYRLMLEKERIASQEKALEEEAAKYGMTADEYESLPLIERPGVDMSGGV